MPHHSKKVICIVFSNLGLGGIQRKIVDIVNTYTIIDPHTSFHIILRKKESYTIDHAIKNPHVHIHVYQDVSEKKHPLGFCFFIFSHIYRYNPTSVIACISPFALPVIVIKKILFWRTFRIMISQDHVTSKALPSLRYAFFNRIGIIFLYRCADSIICPTQTIQSDLVYTYHVPLKKTYVIHNWTNVPIHTTGKKRWDVVYVGRFTKQKNVSLLLHAIHTIYEKTKKPLRVCLCGDGSEKSRYMHIIKKNHLASIVTIKAPTYHIESILQKSKIYVCSSLANTEGFPVAIFDAMASGAVVITSYFNGVEEIIHHKKNGFIFHDEKELILSITSCLDHPSYRAAIAKHAVSSVKTHTALQAIKKYSALL